jgi:maltoporin
MEKNFIKGGINKMVTMYSKKGMIVELRGLSTDTKPTKLGNKDIENGSVYIEIDTGSIYMYDGNAKQWKEI